MRLKSILFFISISLSVFINAQSSVKAFGTCDNAEIARGIELDSYGNQYILNNTQAPHASANIIKSISLSKLNIVSELIWTKAIYLDSTWNNIYASSIECIDSSIFIGGSYSLNDHVIDTTFTLEYDKRNFLAKFSSSGNLIWFKNIDKRAFLNENVDLEKVGQNLIYTSSSRSLNPSIYDRKLNITCLDTSGSVVWSTRLSGTAEGIFDIQALSDSTFVVLGGFDIVDNGGTNNFFITKITTTGNILWQKSYKNSNIDSTQLFRAFSCELTSSGDILLCGLISNIGVTTTNGYFAKIAANTGNVIISKRISVPNTAFVFQKVLSKDGNIILAGQSKDMSGGGNQHLPNMNLTSIQENGTINWVYSYNISQYQQGHQFNYGLIADAVIGAGSVYTLSTFYGFDSTRLSNWDLLHTTIRTTGEAAHRIDTLYPTVVDYAIEPFDSLQFIPGIASDTTNTIFQMTKDYHLNFSNCIALSVEDLTSDDFNIYPNPTSDFITIKTDHKIDSYTIYDVTGKKIMQTAENTIDLRSFTNGIYLLTFEFEGKTKTKKIILN
ncbi:MAG: T9SS type A sorting domain-containing protein [Crocinitomicaceae bacterium]|nr:T9SS type A sorting domain-containing protein [Crocinitomicaceae bacterium]